MTDHFVAVPEADVVAVAAYVLVALVEKVLAVAVCQPFGWLQTCSGHSTSVEHY